MAYYTAGRDPWSDPLSALRRIQDEVNRSFGGFRAAATSEYPPLNIWRHPDGITVTAEVPGVALDEMEITVHLNTLTLRGRRETEPSEAKAAYHRRERPTGGFARTVTLPYNVDGESVRAKASNGILTVELPRPATDKPKRIKIEAA